MEDKQGRQSLIPVEYIHVDHRYQRGIIETKVDAIVAGFEWAKFGALTIMDRDGGPDSGYYAVDGQHRLEAARRLGILAVPCIVHKSDSISHEAAVFVGCNTLRRPVSSFAKYQANVIAGASPEVEINSWLSSSGFCVVENAREVGAIDFPSTLVSTWENDPRAVMNALVSQREIVGHAAMTSSIHRGLWWLEHNGILTADHVPKLTLFGRQKISGAIRSYCAETDTGTGNSAACGRAILRLINNKRKNRIQISGEASHG